MSFSIGVQPWMQAQATRAVMAALEAAGGKGCARFVGGCVRNAVMGIPIDDVDIATSLTPDAVAKAVTAAGLKAVPTGLEHGTVTAISQSQPFEITTLRRDVSTDGRRAVVAFTTDWNEDALRRDFRFNSLYADAKGDVFDPTGEGVADAKAGRTVFVGDARTRIREDYLRILRLFRFHAWYGRGEPDDAALEACAALKGELKSLSAERVAKELLKTLAAKEPRRAISLMAEIGVLAEVLPEAGSRERFERLVEIEQEQFWPPDAELRLAALMPDATAASKAARRLRLSNAQHDRIVAALATEPPVTSWMSPKAARRGVYLNGPLAFPDRVKLAWAASENAAATPQWLGLLAIGQAWRAPALPVNGEDAAGLGVPRGPKVGQVLREVEAWWIDQDFPDDRAAAIEQLRAVAQGLA
jgi:poly(A) polymerase